MTLLSRRIKANIRNTTPVYVWRPSGWTWVFGSMPWLAAAIVVTLIAWGLL